MMAMRLAGLQGDSTKIEELIAALKPSASPAAAITELHSLSQLGATEALPLLESYLTPGSQASQPDAALAILAKVARARLLAESSSQDITDGKARASAKIQRYYAELGITPTALSESLNLFLRHASAEQSPPPLEYYYAARELSDMVYRGPFPDYASLPGVTDANLQQEHGFALKLRLAPLPRSERIKTLIQRLARKEVSRGDEIYDMQLLISEGATASQAVAEQLRLMDGQRGQYTPIGFCALFRVLGGIGDNSQTALIEHFMADADADIANFASQVYRDVKNGTARQYQIGY